MLRAPSDCLKLMRSSIQSHHVWVLRVQISVILYCCKILSDVCQQSNTPVRAPACFGPTFDHQSKDIITDNYRRIVSLTCCASYRRMEYSSFTFIKIPSTKLFIPSDLRVVSYFKGPCDPLITTELRKSTVDCCNVFSYLYNTVL